MSNPDYPVDLVYLWCDTADPVFRANRKKYAVQFGVPLNDDENGEARSKSNDEIKYSLRSAELYVPWVRKVFICINDDQSPPPWLNLENPRLRIVRLSEFVPQEFLPTFNSMTIEHFLWRIPDLLEHFLFASDDMMFGRPLSRDFFFADDEKPYCRFRRLMPPVDANSSGYRKWLENAATLMRSRYAELNDDVKMAMLRWPHHNIDAYLKSDLARIYDIYRAPIEATLRNPFRAEGNIERVLGKYHGIQFLGWHYRQVEETDPETVEAYTYWMFATAVNSASTPGLFCFNDNERLTDYERRHGMRLVSDLLLPEPSSFEKVETAPKPVSKAEREVMEKELKRYCETNTRDNYTWESRMTLVRLRNRRGTSSDHPVLSIIIPVYNAEKYLNECLASVFSSTESMDVEVLCVDDGSSDDSLELLQDWANVAPNLRIVRQKNQGPGVARNSGMDLAKGEYICFLDSDDRLSPGDALLRACEQAKADDLDILLADSSNMAENGNMTLREAGFVREQLPNASVFEPDALGAGLYILAQGAPWAKLFRRQFIDAENLRFPPLKRTEDLPFVQMSLSLAHRIGVMLVPVVDHRIGVATSLESTKDDTPLIFVEAERIFRGALSRRGLLDRFRCAANVSHLVNIAYCLHRVQRFSSFKAIAQYCAEKFPEMGLKGNEVCIAAFSGSFKFVLRVTAAANDMDCLAEIFADVQVSKRLQSLRESSKAVSASKDATIEQLRGMTTQLKGNIAKQREAIVAKNAALEQLRGATAQLRGSVERQREAIDAKNAALEQLRGATAQLKESVAKQREAIEALRRDVSQKKLALASLSNTIEQIKGIVDL